MTVFDYVWSDNENVSLNKSLELSFLLAGLARLFHECRHETVNIGVSADRRLGNADLGLRI
jgi:hypothetical protein